MSCTKLLATMIIFAVLLTAILALGEVMTKQNTDAQMMGPNNTRMASAGNMTSSIMMKPSQNITSSINFMNIISQAIGSKVNVSLSDAATTAGGSVGNGSHAVSAHMDDKNGYLVYQVTVIDPSMNFSKVIVDPGNGQVLLSKQVSKADMMKEEMERHHKMMSMMMGSPQQGMGMMMGPTHQGMTMGPGMMGPGMMGPGMMGPGMMGPGMNQEDPIMNFMISKVFKIMWKRRLAKKLI